MAFLRRLFGGKGGGGYERAIALVEDGRLGEALPLLRDVYEADPRSPRGSVAGYYFRQALVGEGRRLLQAGDRAAAARLLDEAVGHWPDFPDLRFLAGAAASGAGQWRDALDHALTALRRNPDYCEARLLEAASLQALDRPREAAESLDKLLESGRRVDHELVRALAGDEPFTADRLPADLTERVRRAAIGDDTKHRLGQAVALCRAGRWEEGLAIFADLAARRPRYPDIRAKHGAALYQLGRLDEALREVEAALTINDRYRTAVTLRGLVLAEQGRLNEARAFLQDAEPRLEGTAGRHEELFLAYLRAVLDLLLGDTAETRDLLSAWPDLGRQFARAALLLAACDHLDGRRDAASVRLDDLCATWNADAELAFLRAALLLERGQWTAVEAALGQWPRGSGEDRDDRPLLLQARLDVARGRAPEVRTAGLGDGEPELEESPPVHPDAWRQLSAHAHLLAGTPDAALTAARALVAARAGDEETGRLLLAAAAEAGDADVPADLAQRLGPPDSWLPAYVRLLRRRGEAPAAEALVTARRRVRPEVAAWSWLSAGFWLDPVRRWLA